ncbi:HNH endonuclease [Synechocystis salina]|uniref:HNH endonuclease n=1 Tax=Synechocystis salina LEGE 00031 TaxID=1828736 RepID=A0ABR9VSZ8_9SYNC|nr:HNH endonuclease [Synechocystis salina]MBE9242244.1 HNH endonuclease [Synechocystis salina LEGE 00041]MBE9254488.1 HNH endonuclease [Synechocystis salina LEGE 00031]
MLKISPLPLEKRYENYLKTWQSEIDQLVTFADKVKQAKKQYASKRRTKTFQHVCEILDKICSGNRRCNYCEDSVADEVEHIKPKSLYPEFVFVWDNYLYACGQCNTKKNNQYAIFVNNQKFQIISTNQAPPSGVDIFLNPRLDNPLDFIELDLGDDIEDGTFLYQPKYLLEENSLEFIRAEYTITVLNINKEYLLAGRKEAALNFRARLFDYKANKAILTSEKLDNFVRDFKKMRYPSVWYEIKRQRQRLPSINPFFIEFPEIIDW